ncbi:MAG: hypothetical protein JSU82_07990 [Rhodospirillales bacterium]|nr:MAG: hypothetical protein JSU82_07990 [Rhodospirillales bacterium]
MRGVNKSLAQLLTDQLGKDFIIWELPHAARALILKNVADDLQVGLMVDKGRLRGAWIETADLGVRIPSVEAFYDRYEIHAWHQMAVADPEPTGWLTFWRPTYSSRELEERGLKVEAIQEDFAELYHAIAKDPVAFRAQTLELLCNARRPDWATEPGSTFLIIKKGSGLRYCIVACR